MYFWDYRLQKTWLDKCLKSPVPEDPSTSNMVNGRKHCWDLPNSNFIIFIDHSEENWALKRLSLLVISKILGMFVNTFTTNYKYSVLDRVNLMQAIQKILYNS